MPRLSFFPCRLAVDLPYSVVSREELHPRCSMALVHPPVDMAFHRKRLVFSVCGLSDTKKVQLTLGTVHTTQDISASPTSRTGSSWTATCAELNGGVLGVLGLFHGRW